MAPAAVDLALTDRVVLAIVAEGTTHGWAVAELLAPDGPVGQVWTVRRPLVYRSLGNLVGLRLVREVGEAPSVRGPRRTLLRATRRGSARATTWLDTPVEHVRDVRTELLAKLLLAARVGRDTSELVTRQRELFAPIAAEHAARLAEAQGVDAVLLRWRAETSAAAVRFLDGLQ